MTSQILTLLTYTYAYSNFCFYSIHKFVKNAYKYEHFSVHLSSVFFIGEKGLLLPQNVSYLPDLNVIFGPLQMTKQVYSSNYYSIFVNLFFL